MLLSKVARLVRCLGSRRFSSVAATDDLSRIRNIGILAHIDAGKTTVTERMLYYAGTIRAMGEVHDGDTVTDYMAQERDRGITITAAAVTFDWLNHNINLIDTPGHVDFTIEVERTLRVLDGAVIVLDASAGVQAQTLTVWKQANRHNVPCMFFLNKMDKAGASAALCMAAIRNKLGVEPILLQLPHSIQKDSTCNSIIDLVQLTCLSWNSAGKLNDGREFTSTSLTSKDGHIWEEAVHAREEIVSSLCDLDDSFMDKVVNCSNVDSVPCDDIYRALRSVTLEQKMYPVLCGAAYRNVGVQPLLDAVVRYMPAPCDRTHDFMSTYGNNLCALAFKFIRDQKHGPLILARIFTGVIRKGDKIYNVTRGKSEKVNKVMVAFADDYKEVEELKGGAIALLSGLKETVTGDTLTHSSVLKNIPKESTGKLGLAGITVPDPVFMCCAEPSSHLQQKYLDEALKWLQKEDPSLRVRVEAETGQTLLSGMGELHLEIIHDRLLKEYKVDVTLGKLKILYKEALQNRGTHVYTLDRKLANRHHLVTIRLAAVTVPQGSDAVGRVKPRVNKDNSDNLAAIKPYQMEAVERGIEAAIMSGPLLTFPVVNSLAELEWLEVKPGTNEVMIAAAATRCFHEALIKGGVNLLEPVMRVVVEVDSAISNLVVEDLLKRRAYIAHVDRKNDTSIIEAHAPISELHNYSSVLRILTSGLAQLTMEFHSYVPLPADIQEKVISEGV